MKRFIILPILSLIGVLLSVSIHSQIQITSQNTIGGSEYDFPSNICKSSEGFLITGSSFSGISGDKLEEGYGNSDLWLFEIDDNYNIIWQKTYGGDLSEIIKDIQAVGDNNNFIVSGISNSSNSGVVDSSGFGEFDFWIFKMDSVGNIIWKNVFGGTGLENGGKFVQLSNGNIILAGSSNSDSSGCKSENSRGSMDYWVICLDRNGQILWDKTYGGSEADNFGNMLLMSDLELILAGASSSPISGEKSEGCIGMHDIWLVTINTLDGSILWDKTIGGTGDELSSAGLTVHNDNIYLGTASSSGVSGNKTEPSIGGYDFWVLKMDHLGNIIWDRTLGGNSNDLCNDVLFASSDMLILGGSSSSNLSGHKSEPSYGGVDAWIVAIDTLGNVLWDKTVGGSNEDALSFIYEMSTNNYCLGIGSDSDISGVKEENSMGSKDYWLVKIQSFVGMEDVLLNDIKFFPNPFTTGFYVEVPEEYLFADLELYSSLGKELFITNLKGSPGIEISVPGLNSGLYFIKLTSPSGQIFTQKIVKQ